MVYKHRISREIDLLEREKYNLLAHTAAVGKRKGEKEGIRRTHSSPPPMAESLMPTLPANLLVIRNILVTPLVLVRGDLEVDAYAIFAGVGYELAATRWANRLEGGHS